MSIPIWPRRPPASTRSSAATATPTRASPEAPYKFLPTYVGSPNNTPVIINQAYRYNTYLGEVVLGLLPKAGGGYDVVARAGRYLHSHHGHLGDRRPDGQGHRRSRMTTSWRPTKRAGRPDGCAHRHDLCLYRRNQRRQSAGRCLAVEAEVSTRITIDFHLSGRDDAQRQGHVPDGHGDQSQSR